MRVLFILILTGVVAAQSPVPPDVRALAGRVKPGADDWETEQAQEAATSQLQVLAEILEQGDWERLPSIAAAGATSTPLAPSKQGTHDLGAGLQASTWKPNSSAKQPLKLEEALRNLHPRSAHETLEVRHAFKVIGIVLDANKTMVTRVRVERDSRGPQDNKPTEQRTSTWRVTWRRGSNGAPPTILAVDLVAYSAVSAEHPTFTECTASVLDLDGPDGAALRYGGEYWFGRVDGVGEPMLTGHQGLALGDVNGDGREDLYVAMGTGLPNQLLVRRTDGTLMNTAAQSGVGFLDDTKGVLFADMDGDGDQDLLCAVGNAILLAKNDGKGRFGRVVTMRAPTPAAFYSLAVADIDGDGDLDIYGCRYVKLRYGVSVPLPLHDANNGPSNHLLRNDGNDRFTDITRSCGLEVNNRRFSLACVFFDHDLDGDPDLYVANDFGRNNLYRNDRGRFTDVARDAGVEDQAAGMGATVGDYDGDGKPDLYVTNMFSAAGNRVAYQDRFKTGDQERGAIQRYALGNTLFRNLGKGRFEDVSEQAGVRMGRWGWGARFCDLNGDGRDDIVAPNGFLTGRKKDDL